MILSEGEAFAVDETWLKLPAKAKRAVTLSGALVKQEKELIEDALAASQESDLRAIRGSSQARPARADARLENQALENQRLSVQRPER